MGYDKILKVSKWKHGDHVQYFSHSSESYSRICLDRLLQEKKCSNFLFMYLSFFSIFGQVLILKKIILFTSSLGVYPVSRLNTRALMSGRRITEI